MYVILYKNSAPPNKVDKKSSLKNRKEFTNIQFIERNAFDILNPSVLVKNTNDISDIKNYNYMEIPALNRYYFIDSISSEGGLIRINGRCDVLMSHKTDILNSTQYILRQETYNNSPYLEDGMLPISSKHNYKGKVFGRKVSDISCGRIILATTGNGGTPI